MATAGEGSQSQDGRERGDDKGGRDKRSPRVRSSREVMTWLREAIAGTNDLNLEE